MTCLLRVTSYHCTVLLLMIRFRLSTQSVYSIWSLVNYLIFVHEDFPWLVFWTISLMRWCFSIRGISCKYWEQPAAGWLCCETTFDWWNACRLCPWWCWRATMDGSLGMMNSLRVWMQCRNVVQKFDTFLWWNCVIKLHDLLLDCLLLGCQISFFWKSHLHFLVHVYLFWWVGFDPPFGFFTICHSE